MLDSHEAECTLVGAASYSYLTAAAAMRRHDFTVVETIDFFADEEDELPPPMTRSDVMLLNKAQGFPEEEDAETAAANGAAEVSSPSPSKLIASATVTTGGSINLCSLTGHASVHGRHAHFSAQLRREAQFGSSLDIHQLMRKHACKHV